MGFREGLFMGRVGHGDRLGGPCGLPPGIEDYP